MSIYILAASNLSPQNSFGTDALQGAPVEYFRNRLQAIEPDYSQLIDAKLIRRMSRIIKMGVATAADCLQLAGIKEPDAIITGTAYGCLEDTGIFLRNMIEQEEQTLSPTSFIQSTHNTVGAQVALQLQCTNYNNTFVNGGTSFENALTDARMLLDEDEATTVLIGSIEEITDTSFALLSRFGLYKKEPVSNLSLFPSHSRGTIAGEGAAFFLLSSQPGLHKKILLEDSATYFQPGNHQDPVTFIREFFAKNNISVKDIDLLIMGRNGNRSEDKVYSVVQEIMFQNIPAIDFKHLCGEYPTASSFACWLAYSILNTGQIPAASGYHGVPLKSLKKVLIYNHYQGADHSLILLSSIE